MKTPLAKSLFLGVVVAIAVALVVISVVTDVYKVSSNLTYDDDDAYFLNEWNEAGGGDMPTWGFPESVLVQFDIAGRKMAPEVFFSKEFQSALFSSGERFSIATDPPEFLTPFGDSQLGDDEIALAIENEKRKMAAISRLSNPDELPTEVLEGLEFQFQQAQRMNARLFETWDNDSSTSAFVIRPISEAFGLLDPADQTLLEPYRQRLTDVFSVLRLAQELSGEENRAIHRLLLQARKRDREPVARPPNLMVHSQDENERDYSLKASQIAPTTSIRHRIERSLDPSIRSLLTSTFSNTEVLPASSAEGISISQDMSPIPNGYVLPDSENFLVYQSDISAWTRYFSNTVFGGAVLIEEIGVTGVAIPYSNLVIAGHEARISYVMYMDDHWVTRVVALNGIQQYGFFADGKLENEQKEAFIEFCRRIAEARV